MGPVDDDKPAGRWPGANQRLALFGELLKVGVLAAVGSILLVTLPVALAAGNRHLARYLRAEEASVRQYARDFRRALGGGLLVGVVYLVLAALFLLDILIASTGRLPGGTVVLIAGIVAIALATVLLLRATSEWQPRLGWRTAIARGVRAAVDDPLGSLFVLASIGLVVLATWLFIPLVVPAFGCLCFAAVGAHERHAAREG
jgi:uncharacterized membrane protein YesL